MAQTLTDLNAEKDKLLHDIDEKNKLILEYTDKQSSELLKISVVDEKIVIRKRLINLYNSQIEAYTNQLQTLSRQLDSLENQIFLLKEDYSKIICQQYLNKLNRNSLLYILSAKTFNESYMRFLFLRQYNDYRREQADLIQQNIQKFYEVKVNVESKRKTLNNLLITAKNESSMLEQELLERKTTVESLQQAQSNLYNQVMEAEKQAKLLDEKIIALIREEAKKKDANNALSADILKNIGILPWPCKKHVVVGTFGEQNHPVISSIKIKSNGIDIDVLDTPEVTPIHNGTVSRIIFIPGKNASLIVRHGSILSVYSNLSEVNVKNGQVVTKSTVLGKVFTGQGINSNILHFEIWNGEEKQNPLDWLEKF